MIPCLERQANRETVGETVLAEPVIEIDRS